MSTKRTRPTVSGFVKDNAAKGLDIEAIAGLLKTEIEAGNIKTRQAPAKIVRYYLKYYKYQTKEQKAAWAKELEARDQIPMFPVAQEGSAPVGEDVTIAYKTVE